jgi:hypothetical protein
METNNMLNRKNKMILTASLYALLCLLTPGAARAISVGQIDDFEDGTLQGWRMGTTTVTAEHMTNITDGGPTGAGDNFLQVTSHEAHGTTTPGGNRLTFFNRLQWTGDYTAAGITAIAMDLKNISSSEILNMRLAINGGVGPSFDFIGGVFTSTASISLNSGSGWTRAVFSLLPGDLIPISGGTGGNTTGNDVQATLGNVLELRLLNSATSDWSGLPVTATLGVDNLRAVPLPPALALFGSGLVVLLPRRRKQNLQT